MKTLQVLATIIVATLLSTSLAAQNKEIAIRALSLGDLGNTQFMYKKQKSATTYRRYRLITGNAGFSFLGSDNTRSQFSTGFFTGLENRRELNDRFQLIHGLEVGLGGTFSDLSNNQTNLQINATLGYVVGLQYSISEAFSIGIETIPSLSYGYSRSSRNSTATTNHRIGLNLNSNAVAFTGVYRWAADQKS
jgi:opacity protein-like surface antigen